MTEIYQVLLNIIEGKKSLFHDAVQTADLMLRYESIYIGGSGCCGIYSARYPGNRFAAMDPAPPRYYHTRLDTPRKSSPGMY